MSRLGRTFKAGRSSIPPWYGATNLWNRTRGKNNELASDQTPAGVMGNMINYGNQSYGHWSGYTGPGYGPSNWPWSIAFNIATFSNPIYYVRSRTHPEQVDVEYVILYENWNNDHPFGETNFPGLQDKCTAVPMPLKSLCPQITGVDPYFDIWAGPQGSGNAGDQSICIWDLDTDEMWEFEKLARSVPANAQSQNPSATWSAIAAGYTPSASTFAGVFPAPAKWGISASRLGIVGGLITMQDLRDVHAGGTINHALSFATSFNKSSGGASNPWVLPAVAGDGIFGCAVSTIPNGYPNAGQPNPSNGEASHEAWAFTFPNNVDLSAAAPYPLAYALGGAIRDYGMYLRDSTGAGVAIYMEDPRTLGSPYHAQGANAVDPFTLTWPGNDPRWGGLPVGGWNSGDGHTVLNTLPWSQLQVLDPISG